jgi:hypothetical protein
VQRLSGPSASLGDLEETVISLQRSVKLLQGRMNTYAPPRLGTGDESAPGSTRIDDREPVEGNVRARVLAAWRARAGQRGGRR